MQFFLIFNSKLRIFHYILDETSRIADELAPTQLPENFIEGDILRNAIVASDPSVKGEIDRLGNFRGESGRYAIHPYMLYKKESDLLVFHTCATSRRVPSASYHRCFVIDTPQPGTGVGRPRALREIRGAK
jgi:hypothetical protein